MVIAIAPKPDDSQPRRGGMDGPDVNRCRPAGAGKYS